jgi:hypothetical protein
MREQFGAWLLNILIRAGIKRRRATPIHSKAASPRNRRLCLVPHTCRFLGQQSLGCRTNGEGLKSSPRPQSGDGQFDRSNLAAPGRLFYDLVSRIALSLWKKDGPNTLPMCRGLGGALLFSSGASGDGEGECTDHTTGGCP